MAETILSSAIFITLIIGWIDFRSRINTLQTKLEERHRENVRRFERIEDWIDKQEASYGHD